MRTPHLMPRFTARTAANLRVRKEGFRAGLRQYCLFDVQIERLVLNVRASRADADQPGSLELEIRNDVLHDCAGAHRPFLGMLVKGIHVPIIQSLVARPEADLVVPSRVLRMRPPSEMKKTGQALQMVPHIRKNYFEFLVIVCARESNPLHALINRHVWSLPAVITPKPAREAGASQTL